MDNFNSGFPDTGEENVLVGNMRIVVTEMESFTLGTSPLVSG